ncbi:protein-serine/threonine phosphatase [Ranunculus cassubicifolius]
MRPLGIISWQKEENVEKTKSTSTDSKFDEEIKFSGKKSPSSIEVPYIEIMREESKTKTKRSERQMQNLRNEDITLSDLPPLLFGAVSVKVKGKAMENKFRSLDILKANLTFESMWNCLQFVYLYPKNYEFHKVDMIQLWMAQELVPLPPFEDMEFNACFYFNEFERVGIFQLSRLDHSVGQPRYKLNSSIFYLLEQHRYDQYFRIDDSKSRISQNTIHSSLWDSSFDPVKLKELYVANRLSTLMVLHEHGSHLDQVPRDTFLNLPLLRVVDLSSTDIKYLPSSVGNLKDLRYLNLSQTPITTLPRTLCSLDQMQIIKLRGCVKLTTLPKCMRQLINLRHLDVDVAPLLVSMPPGFGDLTELETLPAFVVGKENGCHITELKHMAKLRGTLRILRLENISSLEEVKDASLDQMKYLQSLELQWTGSQDGLKVLENLQPHRGIEELEIVGYGGVRFPSWMGDPLFSKLMTINISDCRLCELLPPLGKLPSLVSLSISDMHAVDIIDWRFCGRGLLDLETVSQLFRSESAFRMLGNLTLNEMPKLEKWSGIKAGDFPHLQRLSISRCSKLTTLPEVWLLESLQQLEITLCPLLASFPDEGLPTSLQFLSIIECRLLKEWCHKELAQDRGKLAYIHNLWIDYQLVHRVRFLCVQLSFPHNFLLLPILFDCMKECDCFVFFICVITNNLPYILIKPACV